MFMPTNGRTVAHDGGKPGTHATKWPPPAQGARPAGPEFGKGMRMKLVFCGTPEFGVPTLEAVIAAGHEVALVVTQPDRAAGRGMEVQAPAVKRVAIERGLPVAQPEKIKNNGEFRARLEEVHPDAILVVAYGRIIPKWMLELPR